MPSAPALINLNRCVLPLVKLNLEIPALGVPGYGITNQYRMKGMSVLLTSRSASWYSTAVEVHFPVDEIVIRERRRAAGLLRMSIQPTMMNLRFSYC